MSRVLNIKDFNYKVPSGAVYVGRAMSRYNLPASKWGSPFKIGKDGTREEVVAMYRKYLMEVLADEEVKAHLEELRGKDLVCWCHSWNGEGENPRYCHADILLELVNA